MPVQPTFPGVYIEEIPSGVRTIAGVPTSVTAFVGRALRGPVNQPVTINGFGDFERIFGGLSLTSSLSFAVRDYFRNGGGQAIIVRLFRGEPPAATAGADPPPTTAKLKLDALTLEARNPGAWGNALRGRIDHNVPEGAAARFNATSNDALFNLTVIDTSTGTTEVFRNVTVDSSARQLDKVLENESTLVRTAGTLPSARPAESDPKGVEVADADKVSDGLELNAETFTGTGFEGKKEGLFALERTDLFNLLCIPPHSLDGDIEETLISDAAVYCERRRAMLIVDPRSTWNTKDLAKSGFATDITTRSKNAAIFFPRIIQSNPLRDNQLEAFMPCGAVAGIMARTDAQRGVWKAPAGIDATLTGVPDLSVTLTDAENGELNPLGINCLRAMPAAGRVIWGARTLQGDDRLASEWKYVPVRRLALFIEESLYRGTQWVVFEGNDDTLWSQIRLNAGAFMNNLFRQGALQGRTPREAYFVKCDAETTTQSDINQGIVNIVVGFAPLKPAEFVFIKLQQLAGQIAA